MDPQPSFLDKHKAINEDNKKEEDLALGDLNLNIDIEKELSKIMCNIPITELMKVPSVRSQVEEFFDGIGQEKTPEVVLEYCQAVTYRALAEYNLAKLKRIHLSTSILQFMRERTGVTLPFT